MRRLRFDLILTYKIIFGIVDVNTDDFFSRYEHRITRGHSLKLTVPQSNIDVHKYFLSRRIVRCWNDLPACNDDFASLASFKRLLNRVDLSSYTHY